MTTMDRLIYRQTLEAPEVQAVKGSLLDVLTPVDGIAWGEPEGLYTTFNCIGVGNATDICNPDPKDFDTASVVDGFRFSNYAGFTCKSVGLDWSDVERRLQSIAMARETVAVEEAFMASDAFQGATDLTPAGGAVAPKVGLALLEADLAAKYGLGVLHAPRVIASLLMDVHLTLDGNKLVTDLGTPMGAGGGYDVANTGPGGDTPAAGEYWMWATGGVQLQRGQWLPLQRQLDRSTNDMTTLVERIYVGSVDCYASAVKVTLS